MQKSLTVVLASILLLASASVGQRLSPSDLEYLGAFAIDGPYDSGSNDWNEYGQRGMSFDPNGDPGNSDSLPGSLWVTGHDYEQWVFELSIPIPVDTTSYSQLPIPTMLTVPTQFSGGCSGTVPRFPGVEVHGGDLWASCIDSYNVGGGDRSDIMWRRNLSDLSNLRGPYHAGPVGDPVFHSNRQGNYMLSIPPDWAAQHLDGKTLATGFHRNAHGGQMGPTIFAFDPENPTDAYPLLYYRQISDCYNNPSLCDFPDYAACDEWSGATWVRTGAGDAVLIAGENFYGGSHYVTGEGWDCDPGFGEVIFYDPYDLIARIAGTLEPWEVVPYATWRPAELWSTSGELGGIAYDQSNGLFYLTEKYAGPGGKAVVHVYSTGSDSNVDYTLTVTKAGAGFGTVTSSPSGIDCGVDCQETYNRGTLVQLTATPFSGSYLAGWSGSSDCTDGAVVMTSDRSCTATFETGTLPTYTLDVSIFGTGDGVVTSAPAGIDCGVDCEEEFDQGAVVNLTASQDADSYFGGWSGDPDCSDSSLTLAADTSCTATFSKIDSNLGLVALYSLNEGSGTTVMDASGNGHSGTLVNGPQWTNGPAIELDGIDDYIDLGTFDVGGSALTMAAWFKADDLANCVAKDCRLISKATSTDEDAHYFMLSTIEVGASTRLRFRLKTAGVTTTLIATSGNLSEGEWVHASAVYDGTSMLLYKDGQLVGSTSKSGSISTNPSVRVWIGGNPFSATERPWDGLVDDVRLYDRPLSTEEIRALPPPSEYGLFSDGFESGTASSWSITSP